MTTKVGRYVQYGWKMDSMKNTIFGYFCIFYVYYNTYEHGLHLICIVIPSLIHTEPIYTKLRISNIEYRISNELYVGTTSRGC